MHPTVDMMGEGASVLTRSEKEWGRASVTALGRSMFAGPLPGR